MKEDIKTLKVLITFYLDMNKAHNKFISKMQQQIIDIKQKENDK